MSTPVRETLESLASLDDGYPRAALDAAVALQEEITPALLRELVAVRDNPQGYAERRGYGRHLYALVLLSHFREVRAHDPIADLRPSPSETSLRRHVHGNAPCFVATHPSRVYGTDPRTRC